jgi:hypothetical protein
MSDSSCCGYETGGLLRAEFCRSLGIDRQLFPIQFGSGRDSRDTIRVVRFTPKDAQKGLSGGRLLLTIAPLVVF